MARGWVSVVIARGDELSEGAGLAFLPPHQARDSGLGMPRQVARGWVSVVTARDVENAEYMKFLLAEEKVHEERLAAREAKK